MSPILIGLRANVLECLRFRDDDLLCLVDLVGSMFIVAARFLFCANNSDERLPSLCRYQ